jgi:hypothetical protein
MTEAAAKKSNRSASYPATTLEQAIANAEKLKQDLGKGPFNRETAARSLGYAGVTGTSSTVISAMVYYDLLVRTGDTYALSALSDEILLHRSDAERQAAIVRAALAPKLFKSLVEQFANRSIPPLLENILMRDYKIINERIARSLKSTFVRTMTFAGVLQNGVIRDVETAPVLQNATKPEAAYVPSPSSTPSDPAPSLAGQLQSLEIISDRLRVSYPTELTNELITNTSFTDALKKLKEVVEKAGTPKPTGSADSLRG